MSRRARILVLGAGFGGLELSATLSSALGQDADIILMDQGEGFVFGFSKLDVMFGKRLPPEVFHPYQDIDKPGLRFVRTTDRLRVESAGQAGRNGRGLLCGRHQSSWPWVLIWIRGRRLDWSRQT